MTLGTPTASFEAAKGQEANSRQRRRALLGLGPIYFFTPALPFCRRTLTAAKPRPGYPSELNTLGDHIKRRRMDLGLVQKDVATQIGVDTWTVTNWEKRGLAPCIRYYPAIIRFLGYEPFDAEQEGTPAQLRAKRLRLGLSQWELAQRLGIDEQTVRRYERGAARASKRCWRILERFLGNRSSSS